MAKRVVELAWFAPLYGELNGMGWDKTVVPFKDEVAIYNYNPVGIDADTGAKPAS
jgi:hypothetical protein